MKGSDDETRARCYIVDHGEMIPEEECQRMLHDFLKSKQYNDIATQQSDAAYGNSAWPCPDCGSKNKPYHVWNCKRLSRR